MSAPLHGQVCLITGGGSGIGLAIAQTIVADGGIVVLTGRTESKLRAAVSTLGASAHYVVGDATDESHIGEAVAMASSLGTLRMAVANAGKGGAAPFLHTSLAEWNDIITTNLTSTFLLFQQAGAAMVAPGKADGLGQCSGSMLAISSIAAVRTHRYMAPYCVSKAAIESLVQNLADELGGSGVRVNAIRPGLVPTDLTTGLMGAQALVDDYLAQMPLGRVGDTADIAAAARFLLGPDSSWITGTCVSVDGGHHLRRGPNLDVLGR
jgi:NAD(P)-dependent dehydrogenase (short-subunit alcohol dehydrogenase family)